MGVPCILRFTTLKHPPLQTEAQPLSALIQPPGDWKSEVDVEHYVWHFFTNIFVVTCL